MTCKKVRHLGTTSQASAGIVGDVLGSDAQRSIAASFAGLHLAVNESIHIDDLGIVKYDYRCIGKITLTCIVVRNLELWGLTVPTTYFSEKSFQNWARVSVDLLGTVFLNIDYTIIRSHRWP